MNFSDWLRDSFAPAPVGKIYCGRLRRRGQTRLSVLVHAGISMVLLGGMFALSWFYFEIREPSLYLKALAVLVVYSCISFFFHPSPDYSNIGWFGGLINNPFRLSDDLNRFLDFLDLILAPGRFWTESLINLARLIRHALG
jgi:hypothetical protein